MDWSRVTETLVGTLAGGFIALGSWWLKERLDRRQTAQAWFEEYFLTEGVDALRSYFMVAELQLVHLLGVESPTGADLPATPYEPLTRVVRFLDCRGLLAVAAALDGVRAQYRSRAYVWDCIGIAKMVGGELDELRRELSAYTIRKKSDIHRLAGNPPVSQLRAKLEAGIDDRIERMNAFVKRHPEAAG